MAYVAQQPRKRFYFRMNEQERDQINFIMKREGIPDAAKAIRYCISEKAAQLQTAETLQLSGSGKAA